MISESESESETVYNSSQTKFKFIMLNGSLMYQRSSTI